MRRRRLVVALVPLAVVTVLAACGSDPAEEVAGPGGQVYVSQCSSCHGADRAGIAAAPSLRESRMVALGEPGLRRIVIEGGSTMPAFGDSLSEQQLDVLVAYLLAGRG